MFPIPATSRWSWSASPSRRVAGAAQPRDGGVEVELLGASTSGPSRRTAPRRRASSTGPFQRTPSSSSPRSTSHGSAASAACRAARSASGRSSAGGCGRRARPRSGAAGSCRPPRPTRARARRAARRHRVAWARGFGDSTSSRWPTSGCSRRAARWSESPSGTPPSLELVFSTHATAPCRPQGVRSEVDAAAQRPATHVRRGRAHALRPHDTPRRLAAGRSDRADHDRRRG